MKKIILLFCLFIFYGCENNTRKIFNTAVQLWNNEKYVESLQNFIAVAKTQPNHNLADDSLYWIATTYHFYLNQPNQAINYYKNIIRQFPKSEFAANSYFYIAKIYEQGNSSSIENAIYVYQDLLANDDLITDEEVMKIYLSIIKNYIKIEQYQNARVILKKMYQKYTNNEEIIAKVYLLLGKSYEKENKFKFAEITYKEAIKKIRISKYREQILFRIANLLETNGEWRQAIKIYERLNKEANNTKVAEYNFRINALKKRLKNR